MVPLIQDAGTSWTDVGMSLKDEGMLSSCGGFEVSLGCYASMNDSYLD